MMEPLFEDDSMDILIQDAQGLGDEVFQPQDPASHFSQPSLEVCCVDGESIVLPSQVCENAAILTEMLSSDLLSQVLTCEDVLQLQPYLPEFSDCDLLSERQKTWDMLFSHQNFKFGSPVTNFSRQMESGLFNPDIAQTRQLFLNLERQNVKKEQRNYYFNLLQKVIVSRQQLIEAASQLPPGQLVKIPASTSSSSAKLGANPRKASALVSDDRVRKRYFDELKALDCCSSSDDDNYPEGPPASLTKKQRRHLSTIQASLSSEFQPIQSTLTPNIYNRLVMVETAGSSKTEVKTEILTESGAKKSSTDPKRTTGDDFKPVIDVLSRVIGSKNVYEVNEESYKVMMSRHRAQRRVGNCKFDPTSEREVLGESRFLDEIGQRVRLCALNKRITPAKVETPKKTKVPVASASSSSDESVQVPKKAVRTKKTTTASTPKPPRAKASAKSRPDRFEADEPASESSPKTPQPSSALVLCSPKEKKEKQLPPPPPPPSLNQETYQSFFCLVRGILLRSDLPTSCKQLVDRVVAWTGSPISPLNEWYSQLMETQQLVGGWTALVQSAVDFLAENGLVVTSGLEASQVATYSWIGQTKDSDMLPDLCSTWFLQQQHPSSSHQTYNMTPHLDSSFEGKLDVEATSDLNDSMLNSPLGVGLGEFGEDASDIGSSTVLDSSDVVHPPRSVTSWTVRPSTLEEKLNYREQERLRYLEPHKAFTFRQHGYESIVGPVKGVYQPGQGLSPSAAKVRGHTLMLPERPGCVTLLALVRDAAARLPNGEGTRAEICELMKQSQYLAPGADASLHSVVSGALDRLHYEADPCVKYDSARKVWIYLHRHRTESEFEQLHIQHQGMPSRVKKPRSERRSSNTTSSPSKATKTPPTSSSSSTSSTASTSSTLAATIAAVAASPVMSPVTSPVMSPVSLPPPPNVPVVASPAPLLELPVPITMPTPIPAPVLPQPTPPQMPPVHAVYKSMPKSNNNAASIIAVRQEASKSSTAQVVVGASQPISVSSSTITAVHSTPTVVTASSTASTIQTFQITTSTGVQTIRVAAPANLPTALLARTLQLSAQQQSVLHGQKVTIGGQTLVNGTNSIKQVILSPQAAKGATSSLLSSPRIVTSASSPNTNTSAPITTSSPGTSIIRLNIPASSAAGMMATNAIRATRLPGSPVRLAGRHAVTSATVVTSTSSMTSPVQTFLIRPPAPGTVINSSGMTTVSNAPRIVMVNNKLINLSTTPITATAGSMGPNTIRAMRPNTTMAVNMASVRKAVPVTQATVLGGGGVRPVLARMVSSPGGANQQQQVITLENLLSLTNAAHQKSGAKTGVMQLPLSAIAGLNVAGATASTGQQPTTVLLQNVKGAQSILLPAGFQGGTINIRGVRLATVSQQQQQALQQHHQLQQQQQAASIASASTLAQSANNKPAFVTRLVAPQPPQPAPPKSSDL